MSAAHTSGPSDGGQYLLLTARFNALVTERLAAAARAALEANGVAASRIVELSVPGAWELPAVAARAAASGRFGAIVACGAVIRGETPHFEHVARAAVDALARIQCDSGVPVGLGLLTTDTLEQALNRAGGKAGNKGEDAALAALETERAIAALAGEGARGA